MSSGARRSLGWVPFKVSSIRYLNEQVFFSGTVLLLWESYSALALVMPVQRSRTTACRCEVAGYSRSLPVVTRVKCRRVALPIRRAIVRKLGLVKEALAPLKIDLVCLGQLDLACRAVQSDCYLEKVDPLAQGRVWCADYLADAAKALGVGHFDKQGHGAK